MKSNRTKILSFFIPVLYGVLAYMIQGLLYKAGLFHYLPGKQTLTGWDAAWYKSIAEDGYLYWGGTQCNSGFFILFPFLWRVLHVGVWGICIMNVLMYAAGFGIIVGLLKPEKRVQILWLTLPPMYFMLVPYTEAVAFLLGSLCLYGIKKSKNLVVFASLFLFSLTRVSVSFMVPALIIMELLANSRGQWWLALRKSLWLYLLPCLMGLGLFVWYQYYVTGIWFLYFKLQAEFWGHTFSLPSFPFITTNYARTFVLNAFATICSILALGKLLHLFIKWLVRGTVAHNRLVVLSLGYLTGVLLLIVFFNFKIEERTVIQGIARYGMCTPFFWVLIQYFIQEHTYKKSHFAYAFIIANIILLAFRSYYDLGTFLYLNISTAMLLLYMLYANKIKWAGVLLIIIGIVAQALLFQDFLTGLHYPD